MRRKELLLAIILAGCSGAPEAPATEDPEEPSASLTRVWSGEGPDLLTNDISPDGRYMSDINWDSGDLQLVDLETGEVRDVTGRGYSNGRYAWTSAFSRAGRRLAVSWYDYESRAHEVQVMDLDGSHLQVILPADPEWTYADVLDWAPSNSEIAVAVQGADDKVWRLGMVPVDGGQLRIVKTLDWAAPGGAQTYPRGKISPDGRFLAYDHPPELDQVSRDIYAVALDGDGTSTLVEHPAWDRLLGWLPEGDGLLFYSDREGRAGIWRLPMRDGRASGDPVLVHMGSRGLVPLGFVGERYFLGRSVEGLRVRTAVIDPESGGVSSPPEPVGDAPAFSSLGSDWAPDGRSLAYVRHDPPPPDPVEVLVLRSTDGDLIREIPFPPAFHTSYATIQWVAPSLIVLFGMEKGRPGIYRLDPTDGTFSRLPDPKDDEPGRVKRFAAGPGGELLYLTRSTEDGASEVLARTAETGEQRVIGTARRPRSLAVSPDGKSLAMVAVDPDIQRPALQIMETNGSGRAQTIYAGSSERRVTEPVAWTPDGTRILVAMRESGGEQALWSVAADGPGQAIRIAGGPEWDGMGEALRVHPDGHRISFVAGRDRGEVLVLKGFSGK